MVQPAASSISASASRNGRPSRAASRRPIEVLPAPISPTSTMLRPASASGERNSLPSVRCCVSWRRTLAHRPSHRPSRCESVEFRTIDEPHLSDRRRGGAGDPWRPAWCSWASFRRTRRRSRSRRCCPTTSSRATGVDRHVEAFLEMLAAERGAARNTLLAYQADLADFAAFAAARGHAAGDVRCAGAAGLHGRPASRRAGGAYRGAATVGAAPVPSLPAARGRARRTTRPRCSTRRACRESLPKYLTEQEVDALARGRRHECRPARARWRGRRWRSYTPAACGCPNCWRCRAAPWAAMRPCC